MREGLQVEDGQITVLPGREKRCAVKPVLQISSCCIEWCRPPLGRTHAPSALALGRAERTRS